jgi:hypothetical protein
MHMPPRLGYPAVSTRQNADVKGRPYLPLPQAVLCGWLNATNPGSVRAGGALLSPEQQVLRGQLVESNPGQYPPTTCGCHGLAPVVKHLPELGYLAFQVPTVHAGFLGVFKDLNHLLFEHKKM